MADKWRISNNAEILPYLQTHCQSPTMMERRGDLVRERLSEGAMERLSEGVTERGGDWAGERVTRKVTK